MKYIKRYPGLTGLILILFLFVSMELISDLHELEKPFTPTRIEWVAHLMQVEYINFKASMAARGLPVPEARMKVGSADTLVLTILQREDVNTAAINVLTNHLQELLHLSYSYYKEVYGWQGDIRLQIFLQAPDKEEEKKEEPQEEKQISTFGYLQAPIALTEYMVLDWSK